MPEAPAPGGLGGVRAEERDLIGSLPGSSATFTTEPKFEVKERERLLQNDYDAPAGHQHYDVQRDGKQFLMIKNEVLAPNRIHVVANALPDAASSR